MFMPIEPAFALAAANSPDLLQFAWQKNVLFVNPSTLLFVLRMVNHFWTQDRQQKNYQEIAERGSELYDRLSAFVGELTEVGSRLGQAQRSYDDCYKKLCGGKGNVIWQAEKLKQLGVNPTRKLPQDMIDVASNVGELEPTVSVPANDHSIAAQH